ncbi:WAP four-disulfide core domain protein 5 [Talpa occidentalis]|uniref:WAP four-disulfide core domain protein 5 n=1 Tax=Talpa occidentalis TaxID=50954 RepID=UPI0023FA0055|nr:WAP four-disulfide core domain protein 5 [Talpa occidentalis]
MKAWSLLLLVGLLALGSQLPTASGRRKKEKPGGCPVDEEPCLLSVPDQCVDDSQCPSSMKCCSRACFRQCVHKVSVKSGSCPQDRLRCLSPTQHLCRQDSDCSGSKRCCPTACGRDCRSPLRGTAPGAGRVLSLAEALRQASATSPATRPGFSARSLGHRQTSEETHPTTQCLCHNSESLELLALPNATSRPFTRAPST